MVSHFGLLCPDTGVRLGTLLNEADEVCLSPRQIAPWKELLDERAPTDDEVLLIQEELKDTPVAVAAIIRESLAAGDQPINDFQAFGASYIQAEALLVDVRVIEVSRVFRLTSRF